jgi:hypothetical protein
MTKALIIPTMFLLLVARPSSPREPVRWIKLLDGYSVVSDSAVDAVVWNIEKKGGLSVQLEAGPSEGFSADPNQARSYAWFKVQTINGYRARFAMVRSGLRTHWEPPGDRRLPPGNVLLVTFPLGGEESSYTANFTAKIANDEELADALLMIMTFDPSKGSF